MTTALRFVPDARPAAASAGRGGLLRQPAQLGEDPLEAIDATLIASALI